LAIPPSEGKKLTPDGFAQIWTKPDGWIEFEVVEGKEKDFGFFYGKCAPTGNVMWVRFPGDPADRILQVSSIADWAADYRRQVRDKLLLVELERIKAEELAKGHPEADFEDLKNDPMVQLQVDQIVSSGLSFLSSNLEPLKKMLVTGRRVRWQPPNPNKLTVSEKPGIPGVKHEDVYWLNGDPKLAKFYKNIKPSVGTLIKDTGTPITVEGVVSSSTDPVQRLQFAKWKCRNCGVVVHRHTTRWVEFPQAPKECTNCNQKDVFEEIHTVYNARTVRLQNNFVDLDDDSTRTLPIWLKGNDQIGRDPIGIKIKVLGHVEKIFNKQQQNYYNVVISHKAELDDKKLVITEWDKTVIRRFAGLESLGYVKAEEKCEHCGKYKQRISKEQYQAWNKIYLAWKNKRTWDNNFGLNIINYSAAVSAGTTLYSYYINRKTQTRYNSYLDRTLTYPGTIDRLSSLVAPYLVLDKAQQQVVLLAATGAPEAEGYRGRINVIFIGTPSTAKSALANWAMKLRRNSQPLSGTSMTGLSATAMVLPEPDGSLAIHYGPIPLAKYAICVIGEFDKLSPEQQNNLLDVMEEGIIHLLKYAQKRDVPAPTTIIATANPRDNRFENPDRITADDLGIEPPKLSRFDKVIIFTDKPHTDTDRTYAEEKSIRDERHRRRGDNAIVTFLQKYIEYAREAIEPVFVDHQCEELLNEYWSQARQLQEDFVLRRHLEGIKRSAKTFARLALSPTVDRWIVNDYAIPFEDATLKPFLQKLVIVRTPEDELYYQIIELIRSTQGASVIVRDEVEKIIANDKRLARYLQGKDFEKRPIPLTGKNEAYAKLCQAIKAHSHVITIRHKPALIVKWNTERQRREEEEQKKRKKEEEESRKMHHQYLDEKATPAPKNKKEISDVTVEISKKDVDSERESKAETETIIEESYMKQGSGNFLKERRSTSDTRYWCDILHEDSSVSAGSAVDILHNSAIAPDLEWDQVNHNRIFQAAFKDSSGDTWAWNLAEDFHGSEPVLIRAIIQKLKQYRIVLGYFTQLEGSDWEVLDQRCKHYGIESPINIYQPQAKRNVRFHDENEEDEDNDEEPRKFVNLRLKNVKGEDIIDVDVGELHRKPIIRGFFANNKIVYNSLELDVVMRARLGRGKLEGVTGENVLQQAVAKQKEYGIEDAAGAFDLATENNSILIAILQDIANIAHMSFQQTCFTGPTRWWSSIYKNVMHIEPSPTRVIPKKKHKRSSKEETYAGAAVLPYKRGMYHNVMVFDYRSLYAKTAIDANVSPDTVCCNDGCKNDPLARVITGDPEVDAKGYWICRKRQGAFPKVLLMLTEKRERIEAEREEAKKAGDTQKVIELGISQQAYKVVGNAGYGAHGSAFCEYADVRVAEIITALGRKHVYDLRDLAEKKFGLTVIYGDTDSNFVTGCTEQIKEDLQKLCKKPVSDGGLGFEVRYEKTFKRLLLVSAKNYVGELEDKGKKYPEIKELVGKKSNTPKWARDIFSKVIDHWINEEYDLMIKEVIDGVARLHKHQVSYDDLLVRKKLGQDPYKGYNKKEQGRLVEKVLGMRERKHKDASIAYLLGNEKLTEDGYSFTKKIDEISLVKYKERLRTTVLKLFHAMDIDPEETHHALRLRTPSPSKLQELLWGTSAKKKKKQQKHNQRAEEVAQ